MQGAGMYLKELDHDSCGIGFIANLKGVKTHHLVEDALTMLENMEHRGATGFDIFTGDGAGILIQIPHEFFNRESKSLGFKLPQFGGYAVGMIFFPKNKEDREKCRTVLNEAIKDAGLELLGYRKVPVRPKGVGEMALENAPEIEQLFVRLRHNIYAPETLERKVFVLRKYVPRLIRNTHHHLAEKFYLSSMSYKTIVYKGQLTTYQLRKYFPDLSDPKFTSAIALIHSRFSTNTFPDWKLAQPFDIIAHNGEINTIRGNINWMRAREVIMESDIFSHEEIEMMVPICDNRRSDSSNLDSMIEILAFAGRSLPHAMMMLVPEAWQEDAAMPGYKRDFYEYHASIMEPWDGPASLCFTDGRIVGATLDRNGLRPSRYILTTDDVLILASEAGALPVAPEKVVERGRVQPGRMLIADIGQGRIIRDDELKREICSQQPYGEWLKKGLLHLDGLRNSTRTAAARTRENTLIREQIVQGMTAEDLRMIVKPLATEGKEPIGSMGSDVPLAVLSTQSRHFSHYFKQLFAQVSNPPIDPIRERLVMSLFMRVGSMRNVLHEGPENCIQIHLDQPILTKEEFYKILHIRRNGFKTVKIDASLAIPYEPGNMERELDRISSQAEEAVQKGANIIVLSNRNVSKTRMPVPSLLAVGTVHHHLLNRRLRGQASILVEAGDAWETHHFATLIGYGATAVYPYLVDDTLAVLSHKEKISASNLQDGFRHGIQYGLLKVMSKMGISTLQSYFGAQIFEILGLSDAVTRRSFNGTVSRLGGLNYDDIARELLSRHEKAYGNDGPSELLPVGGMYQWKRHGEAHTLNPETIPLVQQACIQNDKTLYREYAREINDQSKQAITLRGLLKFKKAKPIDISEVEPVESIFKRFSTGAMSFGSISYEAHSTLAIAMNSIGGKSNSGEGGEDPIRFDRKPNGDWERSAIKQVASGRFGVTSHYLTNAEELQIKMAQGAKPGEGGQLPGYKVDEWIGRTRHSTPGVGLISPPPHHDIYSIEDLAQLIFDLKNANREARINVKLVSEAGVGTIAAGVVKAKADAVLISGHDGGTGASPWSSVQHAGLPWELGIVEAHHTLLANRLRGRVTLQVDGQIRTGRDLAIAAMLGAEEWGISTIALVAMGCVMMRKCHQNTCPVGVATQRKELRKLFTGKPEHVVNFFTFLAEDLREIMASLGIRTVNELVGRSDLLQVNPDITNWKASKLNLAPLLERPVLRANQLPYKHQPQVHGFEHVLDWELLAAAKPYLEHGTPAKASFPIFSVHRSVGALISNEISKEHGAKGLPDERLHYKFTGSAGQSFAAFSTRGLYLELEGEGNDYFGKGLSGATVAVYPHKQAAHGDSQQIIIGNVALYGATSGNMYIRGGAGERFAVRNSGASAVVEGIGDHGCEYMTGGTVVILGDVGRNFGAGMSGGVAYVLDPGRKLKTLTGNDDLISDKLNKQDKRILNGMVREHYERTGSPKAQEVLIYWKEYLAHFRKLIPAEYKAILDKKTEAEQAEAVIRKIG